MSMTFTLRGSDASRRAAITWSSCSALVLLATLTLNCGAAPPETPTSPAFDFQPTTSVEGLMLALIDPAADAIWDAVVVTSTPEGLDEQKPETDEDWLDLERHATLLIEAGNLLQIDGRRIADPGSISELPGIDLEPEEIAARVMSNRSTWVRTARELHDAGHAVLQAAKEENLEALLESGTRLDVACESCHGRFWYPPDATVPGTGDSPSP